MGKVLKIAATYPHGGKPGSAGFTLLEVLIALSIFAVIGMASYRVLDTVILSQDRVQAHADNLRHLQRAMLLMSLDIEQAVNRSIRGPYAEEVASMVAGEGDYLLQLSRTGWRNPLALARSNLQRVAYELGMQQDSEGDASIYEKQELSLLRHYWPVLDQGQDSLPQTQTLLSEVDNAEFRFLDQRGNWHLRWPAGTEQAAEEAMPVAVEIYLDTEQYGEITRLFQLNKLQKEPL